MSVAFVCNNEYHLSLCSEVAPRLRVPSDLFLLGKLPSLERSPRAALPCWRRKVSWFSEGGGRALLSIPRAEVANFCRHAVENPYRALVYFVDKEFSNQLLLRLHPHTTKILVEEGIGLYVGGKPRWGDTLKRMLLAYWATGEWLCFRGLEQGANGYHDHLIARFPDLIPLEKRKHCEVHRFGTAFAPSRCTGPGRHPNGLTQQASNPAFLFVGSGVEVTRNRWLSVAEEQRQLRELFALFEQRGFTCYAKPHPREPVGKYRQLGENVVEIRDERPVELVAEDLAPRAAATYMSTGILNLHHVERRYCLHDWIPRAFPNKAVLRQLLPRIPRVSAPASLDALKAMLDLPPSPEALVGQSGDAGGVMADVLENVIVRCCGGAARSRWAPGKAKRTRHMRQHTAREGRHLRR